MAPKNQARKKATKVVTKKAVTKPSPKKQAIKVSPKKAVYKPAKKKVTRFQQEQATAKQLRQIERLLGEEYSSLAVARRALKAESKPVKSKAKKQTPKKTKTKVTLYQYIPKPVTNLSKSVKEARKQLTGIFEGFKKLANPAYKIPSRTTTNVTPPPKIRQKKPTSIVTAPIVKKIASYKVAGKQATKNVPIKTIKSPRKRVGTPYEVPVKPEDFGSKQAEYEALSPEIREKFFAPTKTVFYGKPRVTKKYSLQDLTGEQRATVRGYMSEIGDHAKEIDTLLKPGQVFAAEIKGHGTYKTFSDAKTMRDYFRMRYDKSGNTLFMSRKMVKDVKVLVWNGTGEQWNERKQAEAAKTQKEAAKRSRVKRRLIKKGPAMEQRLKDQDAEIKRLRKQLRAQKTEKSTAKKGKRK